MGCRDEDSILEHDKKEGKWPDGGAGVSEKLWINADRGGEGKYGQLHAGHRLHCLGRTRRILS